MHFLILLVVHQDTVIPKLTINAFTKSPKLSSTSSSSRTMLTFSTLVRALGVQLLLVTISRLPIFITFARFSNGSILCKKKKKKN